MECSYKVHNLQKRTQGAKNKAKQNKTKTNKHPNKTNKLHPWIQKSLKKKMSFKLLFELRKRIHVTEAVWKRIPNSRGIKMKGAFTGRLKINTGKLNHSVEDRSDQAGLYVQSVADR